ncbi:MAG: hypothetical protein Q9166_000941 [cf. Caloplaca sp. 2 TL-2023]
MGFDALWISPVTKQIDDPPRAWHGYSQQDLYGVNEHFGTAEDLKRLAAALHARGMYLMVDIVVNHFGYSGSADAVEYSSMHPFDHPVNFHPGCFISNWDNQTEVEKCWLGTEDNPLVDVKTELPSVRDKYNSWIQQLLSNYSIDGLRIDTVKHVEQEFWSSFQEAAANTYMLGEVANGDVRYVCPYQEHLHGLLNYPMYYQITHFSNSSKGTTDLVAQMKDLNSNCKDPTLLAPFSENHDQPRFANLTSDVALLKNIIAFTMLADGIPIIYSGQEQHLSGGNDPYNREAIWLQGYRTDTSLYKFIKLLNQLRKHAIALSTNYTTSLAEVVYADDHNLALKKAGSIVAFYNNSGSSAAAYSVTLRSTGFAAKSEVIEVSTCKTAVVTSDGKLNVGIRQGLPKVFVSVSGLSGSDICGR